jgi:hypothetical protein
MIIHHMRNGSIRESIEGAVVPASFEHIYKLVHVSRKGNQNGDGNTTRDIAKK